MSVIRRTNYIRALWIALATTLLAFLVLPSPVDGQESLDSPLPPDAGNPPTVEWTQTNWSSGSTVGWSWLPDAPATTDGSIQPTWRHCEEIVDEGRSLCTDEPPLTPPADPLACYGAERGVLREDAASGLGSSSLGLYPNERSTSPGKSNHMIIGANFEELAGRLAEVAYEVTVLVPSPNGNFELETGPETSVQHTSNGITEIGGVQYVTNNWNKGWRLWVVKADGTGTWKRLPPLAALPEYVPGSVAKIKLIVDLDLGTYVSVSVSSNGQSETVDLRGRPLPAKATGWAPNLVLTVEGQNLWDCKPPAQQFSPNEPITGHISYDDLHFVGEYIACDNKPVTIDMRTNGGNGTGTSGDDVILGTAGNDTINGRGGNDTICASGGNDVINAGPGDDVVLAGGGNDIVNGGDGKDRVRGQNGNDVINGEAGNDNLNGNNGDDRVNGGDGHDYVAGKDGFDTLTGGAGTDTVNGGGKSDLIRGGDGNDTINGNQWRDEIYGGKGNDTIDGGDHNDTIRGDAGNDVISGGRGNDEIVGGAGDDICDGKSGTDTAASCETKRSIP